ncbi:MAG: hypothetical protein NZ602_10915 [Thermoguttaceae bacterium]|nr:hypothetical protein [Thermoguttaceae bacterium]MDW8038655.1 hypothetical protein [Thermoguttaceae bacterium]
MLEPRADTMPQAAHSPAASSPDAKDPMMLLQGLQRRIDRLTVTVVLMALITLTSTAVVFGQLVNWFAGQALLQGGVSLGGTLLGFGFGWFAGRRFGSA